MLNEEVEDEITALSSIYEDTFSRTDEDKIRVIITPADEDVSSEGSRVLYLEATIPAEYPVEAIPDFSLSNLNNSHFSTTLKQDILASLQQQAKEELGACCLYIVIEWAREHLPEWLSHSHTSSTLAKGEEDEAEQHVRQPLQAGHDDEDKVPRTKFMSKAQKRRHYDRFGATNEKPRGHDWVDIVAHLAKK